MSTETEYIGAVKIKDGLFIGDKATSQDLDFLVSSKVTHIINTCLSEINNEWMSIEICYLSFDWKDTEEEIIFEEPYTIYFQIYSFIESALETGESILIHSVKGESRCVCVVLAYLMKKYKWCLTKTLEFLNSRKPDCKIKPNFLFQLVKLENWLAKSEGRSYSKNWEKSEDPEETLLRNTYLNSRPGTFIQCENAKGPKKNKLKWADGGKFEKNKLEGLNLRHPVENGCVTVKSCLKGNEEKFVLQVSGLKKNSKSQNTLNNKNFSDTAKEYGSFEDLKVKKVTRTNSVSRRENSPMVKEPKRSGLKMKKKVQAFGLLGFIDVGKSLKKIVEKNEIKENNNKQRIGSARPSSPYVRRENKDFSVKSQLLKPSWKF